MVKEELDKVWGKGMWKFQAGKMPDANDGDVGVFPFMKRTSGRNGSIHKVTGTVHRKQAGLGIWGIAAHAWKLAPSS